VQKLYTALRSVYGKLRNAISSEALHQLLRPAAHSPLLERRRVEMIISRVRMVAALFALLTPLWIVIDLVVFTWPITILLSIGRLLTTYAFVLLARSHRKSSKIADAHRALAIMFCIPTLFFLYSHPMLSYFRIDGIAAAISAGYAFLPFVMIAGLSVFPLTAVEAALFSLPVLAAEAFVAVAQLDMLRWSSHMGAFWLLLLIASVAALAGMSQLSFMLLLVQQATHDGLTKCFSRSSGEELLDIQFHIAARSGAPLSIAFLDVDNFKVINDTFGHDAGDRVLSEVADSLRSNLRSYDMLLRWGGEEFVIILPDTNGDAAELIFSRLRERGLGTRPDGKPVTASVGLSERGADQSKNWQHLIEVADHRMYQAKQAGKDRTVGCADKHMASATAPRSRVGSPSPELVA
jgi:diguanylate cyclase (GGDEF)-like protein